MTFSTASVVLDPQPLVPEAPRHLLTPLAEPGHFLLVLDNTALEYFTTCPMSAYYKLVLRKEAHAKNAALTFGGAIHEGLEHFLKAQFYKEWYQLGSEHDYNEHEQNQRVLRFFTEHPAPPDEYRTPQAALEVLAAYRVQAGMPDYNWRILADASGPCIERAFELPLGVLHVDEEISCLDNKGPRWEDTNEYGDSCLRASNYVTEIHVAWSGRIDAVAFCNGKARIVDHKTGMVKPEEYQIANQTLGYVWAGQQLWPEHNVEGFCLNAIGTKKPAAGCSMTQRGPRGGPPALDLFRAYFDYTPTRIAQWSHNALMIVEEFVQQLIRGEFSMHTKWCFGKYGRCPYHDVCTIDDVEVRHRVLRSPAFKDVTWNPTAGR